MFCNGFILNKLNGKSKATYFKRYITELSEIDDLKFYFNFFDDLLLILMLFW